MVDKRDPLNECKHWKPSPVTYRVEPGAPKIACRRPQGASQLLKDLKSVVMATLLMLRDEGFARAIAYINGSPMTPSAKDWIEWGEDPNEWGLEDPAERRRRNREEEMAKKKAARAKKQAEGGGRPVGKTTGVGVIDTWIFYFEQNEKVSASNKRTDEKISKAMHREFPGRASAIFDRVQAVRNRYNKGGLTRGVVPKRQSRRYGSDGKVVEVKPGPQAGKGKKAAPKKTLKAKKRKAKA